MMKMSEKSGFQGGIQIFVDYIYDDFHSPPHIEWERVFHSICHRFINIDTHAFPAN
jgi:hypothetical protein